MVILKALLNFFLSETLCNVVMVPLQLAAQPHTASHSLYANGIKERIGNVEERKLLG